MLVGMAPEPRPIYKRTNMNNFTSTIILQSTPQKVYAALTGAIDQWWTEVVDGNAQEAGHIFSVGFGPQVRKTMMVETLIPGKKVSWLVVDALIDLPELKNKIEWIGTRIVWEISGNTEGTVLELKHMGLTREVECYQVCTEGWQHFLRSFEQYISTGTGMPFRLETV